MVRILDQASGFIALNYVGFVKRKCMKSARTGHNNTDLMSTERVWPAQNKKYLRSLND